MQRDPWRGNANKPLSINPWLYVYGNPINRTDPSGYIARGKEADKAEALIGRLRANYNVSISKDWGEIWMYDLVGNPPVCGWVGGKWRTLLGCEFFIVCLP
jgi:hypothetical protein